MRAPSRAVAAALFALAAACSSDGAAPDAATGDPDGSGTVDVGGYELAFACEGTGSPVVVFEAGLGASGMSEWGELVTVTAGVGVRACMYDRAGVGASDPRPRGGGAPTAETQAEELHRLLDGAGIQGPVILVPHSYGGLVARVFADRYADDVAGFVFEDVSTAWEIDLWPRWDDSPWVDGAQTIGIEATERQVLDAAPLGDRPAIVVSQATYEGEGIPRWAARIFARQQGRLAALGDDTIHVRADGAGHFIHRERPDLMLAAIAEVVSAVREDRPLAGCADIFAGERVTCL
jgi:pimeloyl-ACP methyl ester carboxylesterase